MWFMQSEVFPWWQVNELDFVSDFFCTFYNDPRLTNTVVIFVQLFRLHCKKLVINFLTNNPHEPYFFPAGNEVTR